MSGTDPSVALESAAPSWLTRTLRNRLLEQLGRLERCTLTVVDGAERWTLGDGDERLKARVEVHHPEFYRHVALGGSVGAGESYMIGHWSASDLTALMRILVLNRDVLDGMEKGLASLGLTALRAWHAVRRNSRRGSRRNIAAHYDLGNDFFEQMLDPTLMYSSALFERDDDTLETAQVRKLDRICRKLELVPGDHVLEIGTGWGGFALHAAANYGCRVTTTTISREQYLLATERVQAAGLEDRITLLQQDYRDLEGTYDKIVSIEMIEAVGHQYLPTYLAKIADLLRRDGMALIQAITIEDHRFDKALREVDFIKRHIFPGSFIPSVTAILKAMAEQTDLRLFHLEDIGPSYARTLRAWCERFQANLGAIRRLGYPESFLRMWEFYLAYCEGGFLERSIGNAQLLFTRPDCRRASVLGEL
ncbi:MAG: cyclopropane-fatty-acyl-phospholipid synthase family protein [Xanthomonadales bacterium]|nr:cyclopropane-fatty-acyl-phospholipid synthase family protein [Xanthomonadales bacterium]